MLRSDDRAQPYTAKPLFAAQVKPSSDEQPAEAGSGRDGAAFKSSAGGTVKRTSRRRPLIALHS